MSDIEGLRKSILEKAQQKGQQALQEHQAIIKVQFEKKKSDLMAKITAEWQLKQKILKQQQQVECQQLQNEERQSMLAAKQAILQELFEDAYQTMCNWSVEEELTFVSSVLQKYADQSVTIFFGDISLQKISERVFESLKLKYPNIEFSHQAIPHEAGFLVTTGRIDDTYLYRELITSIYEKDHSRIAHAIFPN